jgi:hypothetical protein
MAGLPENVWFAKWANYQHTNATRWIKVHVSVMYDERTRGADGTQGRLLRGMLMACVGQSKVSTRAWVGQCTDKRSARLEIKRWIDNGLLSVVPPPIDREIERKRVSGADGAPRKRRTTAQPATNGTVGNWLRPVVAEWREKHGGDPDSRVLGKLMKGLAPIYDKGNGQTPAQMGERFACWLNLKPEGKHAYVEDFTSRYGDYDPEKLRNGEYALGLNP